MLPVKREADDSEGEKYMEMPWMRAGDVRARKEGWNEEADAVRPCRWCSPRHGR